MDILLKKKIAKCIEPVINVMNWPFAKLSGMSGNMEKAILWPIIKSFSKHSRINNIQYCSLPKYIDAVEVDINASDFSNYAIVMQGPISDIQFTSDTIRFYKKCYPNVKIIVSTWKNTDLKTKKILTKLNVTLLESEEPSVAGAGNINKQLISSYVGIKKADELNCQYSVKTRTDQRVYANDMLQYFTNLVSAFPPGDRKIVNKRIVFISYGKSFRYLPFNLCDFMSFGETKELLKLYGIERDSRDLNYHSSYAKEQREFNRLFFDKLEKNSSVSPYDLIPNFEECYFKYMYAEYYIVYKYFNENICNLNSNDDLLDAYYYYLKNFAIIADSEKLLVYWPKYDTNQVKNETEIDFLAKLDFKKWIDIYLNYECKGQWCCK